MDIRLDDKLLVLRDTNGQYQVWAYLVVGLQGSNVVCCEVREGVTDYSSRLVLSREGAIESRRRYLES